MSLNKLSVVLLSIFNTMSFLLAQTTFAQAPVQQLDDKVASLRLEAARLKTDYANRDVDPTSSDYILFAQIGSAALSSPDLIDELIDLCDIKETPPKTTEKYTPSRLSPAGRELIKLGAIAKERVEEELKSNSLGNWKRVVLTEVQKLLAHREQPQSVSKQEQPTPILRTTDLRELRALETTTRQEADDAATSRTPPVQPTDSKKAPETEFVPNTPSEEPTLFMPWGILVVLGVVALGLLALVLKRRS